MIKNQNNIDKMIISVLACNRPKHLYVTLDSIFKMRGIEKYPVSIMVIYNGRELLEQQMYYISQFPISEIKICYEQPSCYWNHLSQFTYLSELNYEWLLLVEDDIILHPDSLEYLNKINKHAFVYCLYNNSVQDGELTPLLRYGTGNVFANLYNRASLEILSAWQRANMSNGLSVPGTTEMIYNEYNYCEYGNDVKISAFNKKMDIVESVPSRSLAFHFGLNANIEASMRNSMEDQMFSGPKEQWLDNVLGVLAEYKDNPDITKILRPSHFEYR